MAKKCSRQNTACHLIPSTVTLNTMKFFRAPRFTDLLDSSTAAERGDAWLVAEPHLCRGGRTDALRQVEKRSRDRSNTGRQPASRQKRSGADRYSRVSELHVHRCQRPRHNRRYHNGEGSMCVSSFDLPTDRGHRLTSFSFPLVDYRGLRDTRQLVARYISIRLCPYRESIRLDPAS